MPDCHKCPNNRKRSEACLKCPGPAETNNHGRTHISIDSGEDGQTMGEVEASWSAEHLTVSRNVPRVHPDVLKLVSAFAMLSDTEFALVRAYLNRRSMADLGRMTGLTRAAISARLARLVEKHPVFGFMQG